MKTFVLRVDLKEEEDGRWSSSIPALPGCSRSLSVLLMFCPAQSERYFYSVLLNTAVSFETKQNESIFDPIPSQEGLLFVLV